MGIRATDLFVTYGDGPESMVRSILNRVNILDELPANKTIVIKPNLVVSKPSDSGATTEPRIVSALISYLQENGFENLIIMESSWLGDNTETAFEVCGYKEISKRFKVPLVNLTRDSAVTIRDGDISIEVCKRVTQIGYLINVPVLKAHCQTRFTCALKNLKGLIPDAEKRRFHTRGLHRPIAELNRIIKTDLVIVDGIIGDLTFEEGGNPVAMNRIIVGRDPVLVDAYGATLIGYRPDEIDYISISESLGVGSADLAAAQVHELGTAEGTGIASPDTDSVRALDRFVLQDQACSACFGSLVHALKRLSEKPGFRPGPEKIHVGQGFKEKSGPGLGVGVCTKGLACHLPGCPSNTRDIVDFLRASWLRR